MKAYIIVTGLLFVAITVAHVLRVVAEGTHVVTNPFFLAMTLLAVGMAAWAGALLRLTNRATH